MYSLGLAKPFCKRRQLPISVLGRQIYKSQAPAAPTTARAPVLALAATPVACGAEGDAEAPAAEPPFLVVEAEAEAAAAAGAVVGSETPLGQCQWSP
jgi:hypothetical protein